MDGRIIAAALLLVTLPVADFQLGYLWTRTALRSLSFFGHCSIPNSSSSGYSFPIVHHPCQSKQLSKVIFHQANLCCSVPFDYQWCVSSVQYNITSCLVLPSNDGSLLVIVLSVLVTISYNHFLKLVTEKLNTSMRQQSFYPLPLFLILFIPTFSFLSGKVSLMYFVLSLCHPTFNFFCFWWVQVFISFPLQFELIV